jgi:hypothetical protein
MWNGLNSGHTRRWQGEPVHELILISAIGTAVASLIYLGRLSRRIVATLELYTSLPGRVVELADKTESNTAALHSLTSEVRRLASVEGGRIPPQ